MSPNLPMFRVRFLSFAIALAIGAAPAFAQETDHSKMHMPAPAAKIPAAKAPMARKPAAKKPASTPASVAPKKPPADPHAGHVMPAPTTAPTSTAVDHAAMGHETPAPQEPAEAIDHAAMGHEMPMPTQAEPVEPMDHAAMGHGVPTPEADIPAEQTDHAAMGHSMLGAPTEPRTPIPALTQADRIAAFPDVAGHAAHDNAIHSYWLLDRLEGWNADEGTGLAWEAQSWIGTDLDRVWLRSEGERVDGITEAADLEVLYGRSITAWWDVVAGVRHDFGQGPSQTFAAFGVMGLAPYKYEVEATAYIGQSGQTAARVELEYDTLLTNRLILQSLAEAELYGKDDERRGIGSGLSTVEVGFRLRYEFTRKIAPYIGVVHERAFGGTADFRRDADHDVDDTRFVAGLRIWF
ncbi:MAG: copper resistance protein B [Lysobacter sp.]